MTARILILVALALQSATTPAQSYERRSVPGPSGMSYVIATPSGHEASRPIPIVISPRAPDGGLDGVKKLWSAAPASSSWIAVFPTVADPAKRDDAWRALFRDLRVRHRPAGERFRLFGGAREVLELAQDFRFEIGSAAPLGRPKRAPRLRANGLRGVTVVTTDAALTKTVRRAGATVVGSGDAWKAMAPRTRSGPDAAVHAALDDFHDAATRADEDRYFGLFAPEGVFLGTDATERWTLARFKDFALPYFKRESAWIFVPQSRNVDLGPDGTVAWFDEVLGSASYGECRGSGVLRKIDGAWRVCHYNLTVPVPNDLLKDVVSGIDLWDRRGWVPAKPTTVYIVRHAEKVPGDDPVLTEKGRARAASLARILGNAGIGAVLTSEFKRTKETGAPTAAAAGITPKVIGAAKLRTLIEEIVKTNAGRNVLVVGHSNTVPAIIRALGVEVQIRITEQQYDNIFVVHLEPDGTTVLHRLQYP